MPPAARDAKITLGLTLAVASLLATAAYAALANGPASPLAANVNPGETLVRNAIEEGAVGVATLPSGGPRDSGDVVKRCLKDAVGADQPTLPTSQLAYVTAVTEAAIAGIAEVEASGFLTSTSEDGLCAAADGFMTSVLDDVPASPSLAAGDTLVTQAFATAFFHGVTEAYLASPPDASPPDVDDWATGAVAHVLGWIAAEDENANAFANALNANAWLDAVAAYQADVVAEGLAALPQDATAMQVDALAAWTAGTTTGTLDGLLRRADGVANAPLTAPAGNVAAALAAWYGNLGGPTALPPTLATPDPVGVEAFAASLAAAGGQAIAASGACPGAEAVGAWAAGAATGAGPHLNRIPGEADAAVAAYAVALGGSGVTALCGITNPGEARLALIEDYATAVAGGVAAAAEAAAPAQIALAQAYVAEISAGVGPFVSANPDDLDAKAAIAALEGAVDAPVAAIMAEKAIVQSVATTATVKAAAAGLVAGIGVISNEAPLSDTARAALREFTGRVMLGIVNSALDGKYSEIKSATVAAWVDSTFLGYDRLIAFATGPSTPGERRTAVETAGAFGEAIGLGADSWLNRPVDDATVVLTTLAGAYPGILTKAGFDALGASGVEVNPHALNGFVLDVIIPETVTFVTTDTPANAGTVLAALPGHATLLAQAMTWTAGCNDANDPTSMATTCPEYVAAARFAHAVGSAGPPASLSDPSWIESVLPAVVAIGTGVVACAPTTVSATPLPGSPAGTFAGAEYIAGMADGLLGGGDGEDLGPLAVWTQGAACSAITVTHESVGIVEREIARATIDRLDPAGLVPTPPPLPIIDAVVRPALENAPVTGDDLDAEAKAYVAYVSAIASGVPMPPDPTSFLTIHPLQIPVLGAYLKGITNAAPNVLDEVTLIQNQVPDTTAQQDALNDYYDALETWAGEMSGAGVAIATQSDPAPTPPSVATVAAVQTWLGTLGTGEHEITDFVHVDDSRIGSYAGAIATEALAALGVPADEVDPTLLAEWLGSISGAAYYYFIGNDGNPLHGGFTPQTGEHAQSPWVQWITYVSGQPGSVGAEAYANWWLGAGNAEIGAAYFADFFLKLAGAGLMATTTTIDESPKGAALTAWSDALVEAALDRPFTVDAKGILNQYASGIAMGGVEWAKKAPDQIDSKDAERIAKFVDAATVYGTGWLEEPPTEPDVYAPEYDPVPFVDAHLAYGSAIARAAGDLPFTLPDAHYDAVLAYVDALAHAAPGMPPEPSADYPTRVTLWVSAAADGIVKGAEERLAAAPGAPPAEADIALAAAFIRAFTEESLWDLPPPSAAAYAYVVSVHDAVVQGVTCNADALAGADGADAAVRCAAFGRELGRATAHLVRDRLDPVTDGPLPDVTPPDVPVTLPGGGPIDLPPAPGSPIPDYDAILQDALETVAALVPEIPGAPNVTMPDLPGAPLPVGVPGDVVPPIPPGTVEGLLEGLLQVVIGAAPPVGGGPVPALPTAGPVIAAVTAAVGSTLAQVHPPPAGVPTLPPTPGASELAASAECVKTTAVSLALALSTVAADLKAPLSAGDEARLVAWAEAGHAVALAHLARGGSCSTLPGVVAAYLANAPKASGLDPADPVVKVTSSGVTLNAAQLDGTRWLSGLAANQFRVTPALAAAATEWEVLWKANGEPTANGAVLRLTSANGAWTGSIGLDDLARMPDGATVNFRVRSTVAGQAGELHPASDAPPFRYRMDRVAPTVAVATPATSPTGTFTVSWTASDAAGSGIDTLTVQYRDGEGAWQSWIGDADGASATFSGDDGRTYAFRARATDATGHASEWSPTSATRISIPPDAPAPANRPPTVRFTSLEEGAVFTKPVEVRCAASDPDGTTPVVAITLLRDGREILKLHEGSTCAFTLDVAKLPEGELQLKAVATDGTKHGTALSPKFTIDRSAPRIAGAQAKSDGNLVLLTARVSDASVVDAAILSADCTGGVLQGVRLLDDGRLPDERKSDGVWSAIVKLDFGSYCVRVSARDARGLESTHEAGFAHEAAPEPGTRPSRGTAPPADATPPAPGPSPAPEAPPAPAKKRGIPLADPLALLAAAAVALGLAGRRRRR